MSIAEKLTTIAENEQKVYEAGRKAELDLLWDTIQIKGNRTDYSYYFMDWDGSVFYPKYDFNLAATTIHGSGANIGVFRNFNKGYTKFDLSERLEECGVVINTSECTTLQYLFMGANVSRIPTIDLSKVANSYMAFYDTRATAIDGLIFSETTIPNNNTFLYSGNLTTITKIEGVIAKSISFSYNPLDVPTMNRIIAHLKDYSSIGGTYTLTFKQDRETMLTDEEKAVATNKGWTLVWG